MSFSKVCTGVLVGLTSLWLAGCTAIGTGIGKAAVDAQVTMKSKYNPIPVTLSDYQAFVNLARSEQGKLLTDDKGFHYFRFYDDGKYFCQVHTSKNDIDSINQLLISGKGLVEPFYRFDENFEAISPDWELTGELIAVLTKKGFNVHPLEVTKKYDALLQSWMRNEIAAGYKTDGFVSGSGLHKDFMNEAAKTVAEFDYLVEANMFYRNLPALAFFKKLALTDPGYTTIPELRAMRAMGFNTMVEMQKKHGAITIFSRNLTRNADANNKNRFLEHGGGWYLSGQCFDVEQHSNIYVNDRNVAETVDKFNFYRYDEKAHTYDYKISKEFFLEIKDIFKVASFQKSKALAE